MSRLLFAIVALACAMVLTALTVHAEAPSLTERLVQAQRLPGVRHTKEPTVDEIELASAITTASKGDRTLAAALLTIAAMESGLRARIAIGDCAPHECDSYKDRDGVHPRAWGLYQAHKSALNADVWGSPSLLDQSRDAARQLRGWYFTCSKSPDRMLATFRGYGSGRGCRHEVPREAMRLQLFERIRRVVQ